MKNNSNHKLKNLDVKRIFFSALFVFLGITAIIFTLWISGCGFILLGFLIFFKSYFFKMTEERRNSQMARDQYVKMYQNVSGKQAPDSLKKDGLIRFYDTVFIMSIILIISGIVQMPNLIM